MTFRRMLPLTLLALAAAAVPALASAPSSIQSAPQAAATQADTAPCQNPTVDQAFAPKAAAAARAFLVEFQSALAANEKSKIAAMVSYPMTQIHKGKPLRIANATSFLQNFDRIFTPVVRSAVAHQSARCLFGNDSGAMVGGGEVWFSQQSPDGPFKINTVNSDAGL